MTLFLAAALRRTRSRKGGFTIIELLVTISILAIVAIVGLVAVGDSKEKANIALTIDAILPRNFEAHPCRPRLHLLPTAADYQRPFLSRRR